MANVTDKLLQEDLRRVVRRLPKDIIKLIQEKGIFLGGGFIRALVCGEKPNDIDLFGPSKDRIELCVELLQKEGRKPRVLRTDNAITLIEPPRAAVQFITRWLYDDPRQCLREFDFTIAQAVVWWDESGWRSAVAPTFYADLASRRLRYTQPSRNEDAGGSMLRMRKFLGRGYHVSADDLALLMARVTVKMTQHPNFNAIATSENEQADILRGLLREVDPWLVVDGIDPVEVDHEDQ